MSTKKNKGELTHSLTWMNALKHGFWMAFSGLSTFPPQNAHLQLRWTDLVSGMNHQVLVLYLNHPRRWRVPNAEAKETPKWQIFKAPLRMERTRRACWSLWWPPESVGRAWPPRPGTRRIPDGRIDSTSDVSAAFLCGDATSRQIFVRAPNEGLPAAAGELAVPGRTLFQILRSAYGLTEAPRL